MRWPIAPRGIAARTGAATLACALTFAVAACVPPAPPPPRPDEAEVQKHQREREARERATGRPSTASRHAGRRDGLEGGVQVFFDDFERAELGADWVGHQPGEWTIDGGRLRANRVAAYDDRNKGVWLQRKLPAKVRVEFEAEVMSDKGDVKCEIFATEPKHEAGYSVIFGGWDNTINTIARRGEHEPARQIQRPHTPVRSRVVQRWALVRNDGVLRWYVDGRFMLAYDDPDPVEGGSFAFNNWLSDVRFDNLRIFDLAAKAGE